MRTTRRLLVFPLMLLTIAASPAFADLRAQSAAADAAQSRQTGTTTAGRHLVPAGDLAAAIVDRIAHQDADRAAIREALARPEVRSVASSMHLDVARAADAVATMSGVDLEQAANAARSVNQQLVGGASTIVISTTTIIIILLLVIILIIAVK